MMQRPRLLLVSPLLLCAALAACSSGGSSSPAASVSADSSDASGSDAPSTDTTAAASSSSRAAPATSTAAATSAAPAPAPAGGSVITFTGKFAGRMTATACQGGIAQLEVDIDGQPTTYAGIIDADDFTFVAPNSAGFTLAKGAAKPKVTGGGTTFTVHGTKLIGILNDDTVTATGSVTCP